MNAPPAKVFFAASILIIAVWGCSRDVTAPSRDALESCSPFRSFDNKKEMDFDFRHDMVRLRTVTASPSNAPSDDVDSASDTRTTTGTFTLNETQHTIKIETDGVASTYVVSQPGDQLQCILASGSLESANLVLSWYGVPPTDDSDSNDDSP